MVALAAEARRRVTAHLMRIWKTSGLGLIPVNKIELRAAVDAADQWVEDNAASFNAALPQPFRGAAGPAQKSFLLCTVVMRRAGILRTEEDGG